MSTKLQYLYPLYKISKIVCQNQPTKINNGTFTPDSSVVSAGSEASQSD